MSEEQTTNTAEDTQPESPELEALKRERDENYDRYVRKAAEFDNYRRRVEKERREQADRAVVSLLEDLLSVVDDFDLALTVDAGEGGSAYRKGVELIHAKLQDMLRKQGVKTIDAETLASIPLGSPVLPRPGSFMVKIVSDPKTYYVSPGYRLHWIEDEAAE